MGTAASANVHQTDTQANIDPTKLRAVLVMQVEGTREDKQQQALKAISKTVQCSSPLEHIAVKVSRPHMKIGHYVTHYRRNSPTHFRTVDSEEEEEDEEPEDLSEDPFGDELYEADRPRVHYRYFLNPLNSESEISDLDSPQVEDKIASNKYEETGSDMKTATTPPIGSHGLVQYTKVEKRKRPLADEQSKLLTIVNEF